jgi:hypothetical protein
VGRGDGYILIPAEGETYLVGELFDAMHEYFEHHRISLSRIIYMTNCPNAQAIYDQYANQQRWARKERMVMQYANPFLIRDYRQKYKNTQEHYTPGHRAKTFLSFNYAHHDHRMILIALANRYQLLENSWFSMPQFDYAKTFKRQLVSDIHRAAETGHVLGINHDLIDATEALLPMVLDEEFTRATQDESPSAVALYENSLISLISETNFYGIGRKRALDNPAIHVTEKTFKAITWLHPFVMVSAAGTLAHLRDLGFKTFGQWWDESYDNISNANDRMRAIFDVLRTINRWDEAKRLEFSHEVKSVVDYNYAHLRAMPDVGVLDFVERFGV